MLLYQSQQIVGLCVTPYMYTSVLCTPKYIIIADWMVLPGTCSATIVRMQPHNLVVFYYFI